MTQALTLRLQATLDLLKRYAAIFSHVWKIRKDLDPPHRLPHEAQFLPAALELQETPVSAAPRIVAWLLMSFALIAVLWAIFGQIDVVATAQGKIVPNEGSKLIQPIETAAVKAIHVVDGQAVKAGQVLVELDATMARADSTRTANDLTTAKLQAARARGLLAALTTGKTPRIETPLGIGAGIDASIGIERIAQEQRILDGQYGEYQARVSRIDAEIAKREAERRSTQETVKKLEQTAPIARQRAEDFKGLVEKNFISKHGYLEKEQARIEQEADLETQKSRLKELAAAIEEAKGQRNSAVAETRRLALDTLNEAEQKATGFGQELVKSDTRGKLMTLTAPVDGTVQQLAVRTVGGVVTPAQALMVIVPKDDALEVEAFLENKDIGFVNAGQQAEVKIETFPFTKYGTIPASLVHVSRDAINDEKRGPIYSTRARLQRATMQVEDKTVNLSAGMVVSVEIKTGKRRVIEYFLSPLLQHGSESLRER
ncbi:HlyD family type I secretion periplasmic adaptor subunit [Sulfuritalea hydrogenivorans]|uniref:Membrane fusion protein (MFP) family protein n=1 Tax=Sulfuritalea hydrogenivorans sk43H TaxID=1223802 RepID=W0SEE7_9PROT|nr:HlyD family type I secretion periplasmic adaptor subunit [Sulfuritalea hydrogenivorans]BAO29609.1 HlyD-family type I secretion protein [Sulfuritalea hydrogenivorans sk43H]